MHKIEFLALVSRAAWHWAALNTIAQYGGKRMDLLTLRYKEHVMGKVTNGPFEAGRIFYCMYPREGEKSGWYYASREGYQGPFGEDWEAQEDLDDRVSAGKPRDELYPRADY